MITNLQLIKAAVTWADVERAIAFAVECGILVDKRKEMPRGRDPQGKIKNWRKRKTPSDVLGHVVHHNASKNFTNPIATGQYHASKNNHITPGRPLPSGVYMIMIPDIPGPAWLTVDLASITYGQGSHDIGDENRHLLPILVMGGFESPGFKRPWTKPQPSDHQLENLANVVAWLQRVFSYGGEGFFGHYHFGKAHCPGQYVATWTEDVRAADDHADLLSDREWQEALLRWNPQALPNFGADGDWGGESKFWLSQFQRSMGIRVTAAQDPFSELILLQRYPDPKLVIPFSGGKEYTAANPRAEDIGENDVVLEIDVSKLEPITSVGGKPVTMEHAERDVLADDVSTVLRAPQSVVDKVVDPPVEEAAEEEWELSRVDATGITMRSDPMVKQIDDSEDPPE